MTTRKTLAIYAGLSVYMLAPVLSVLIAASVASLTGAALDEGNAHPCFVLGSDIGELLYAMFVFGWLGLITLPTGALAILIFSFVRPKITRDADVR
jgi:hypothetical protein